MIRSCRSGGVSAASASPPGSRNTAAPGGRTPPLAALPFFEAAGRHESFAKAADELCVSSTAVANRIKALEQALGFSLFYRHRRGVTLNRRGKGYLQDIQRILTEFNDINERHCDSAVRVLRVVAVESLAATWMMPRIAEFQTAHPQLGIKLESDHGGVEFSQREFDVRIAFTSEVDDGLYAETLLEETLIPVCSPSFVQAKGKPAQPGDLRAFPLLYDMACERYWSFWFACHHVPAPDLATASGFGLHTLMIQAAVNGLGIALGHSRTIARELEQGALVHLFGPPVAAPDRYVLITKPHSRDRSDIRSFRAWILSLAGNTGGLDTICNAPVRTIR